MDLLQQLICFRCVSGSKVPLACICHEEQFYTVVSVPRIGAGDLADIKPWISTYAVKLE